MSTKLKCPNCNYEFPLEAALNDELNTMLESEKKNYRNKMNDFLKSKETEFNKKEEALKQQEIIWKKQWEEETKKKNEALEESIRKSLAGDFENEIKGLKKSEQEKEEKLKTARAKEFEYLQKEKLLKDKEDELDLKLQRQLMEEREKIKEQLIKDENQKLIIKEQEFDLKLKEKDKLLDDQKKLVEEMRRKSEQGSMQLQGEVLELKLEELLKITFPFDKIEEVPKGINGADCIQIVHNNVGNKIGKILFESKNTKAFSIEWIEKLKADMRSLNADAALIVTKTLPKDMEYFGEKEGIYICTFYEVRSVVLLLRNGLLKLAEARKSQENKGDKMVMLYDYLTSHEFAEQWKAIREGFRAMKNSIQKEREAMEKLWKQREKQLEKVLLNATHVRGSIEGIADSVNLSLLDDDDVLMLD